MNRTALFAVCFFIATITNAQTSVIYDFESLTNSSPIHGQDNWFVHSSYSNVNNGNVCPPAAGTAIPPGIYTSTGAGSYTSSKALNTPMGVPFGLAFQHAYCSRVNDGTWSTPSFNGANGIVLEADFTGNHWGKQLRLAYDSNNDGNYSSTCRNGDDPNEISFGFGTTPTSIVLYGANGNVIASGSRHGEKNNWHRIRLCIDLTANGGQGAGYIFYKNHSNNGNWTPHSISGINMGFNTSATDQTNYLNIDGLVFDQEAGEASFIDNISIDVYTNNFSGCITALPIQLIHFDALPAENKFVQTGWATASENNNDFFNVQRSKDAIDWETIAKVDGAGNSSTKLNYSYSDTNPHTGLSYYRLKQVDFDGNPEYSDIKSVYISSSQEREVKIYPNPTQNTITVIGDNEELSDINIINNIGQLMTTFVKVESFSKNKITLNLMNLPSGIYTIKTKTKANKVYKE